MASVDLSFRGWYNPTIKKKLIAVSGISDGSEK